MKSTLFAVFAFVLTGLFSGARADDIRLQLASDMSNAGTLQLSFELADVTQNRILSDSDLAIDHEMKLHLFIFDPALAQFRHVHPQFDGQQWNVTTDLEVNGTYWVWAQGELASTQSEFTVPARLMIMGGYPENPAPPALGDVRVGQDQNSVVTVSRNALHANQMAMMNLIITRADGTQPQLSPYLGAPAHAVLVPVDGSALIHVHPMAGSDPTHMMLHTEFPAPGYYRLWLQFVDGGVLRTVALSLAVQP